MHNRCLTTDAFTRMQIKCFHYNVQQMLSLECKTDAFTRMRNSFSSNPRLVPTPIHNSCFVSSPQDYCLLLFTTPIYKSSLVSSPQLLLGLDPRIGAIAIPNSSFVSDPSLPNHYVSDPSLPSHCSSSVHNNRVVK